MKTHWLVVVVALLLSVLDAQAQTSREFRHDHTVGVDVAFSLLSLPLPASKGVAINFNASDDWQVGASYMSSGISVDLLAVTLAGITERHMGLHARRFWGNSFNVHAAYVYRKNDIFLDPQAYGFSVTSHHVGSETRTHMIHLGVSNHWQYNHWTFAADWLTLTLPLAGDVYQSVSDLASSSRNKQRIRDAETLLVWYPNVSLLTLRLGYMF